MHDYYISATVKPKSHPEFPGWSLWSARVMAVSLSEARADALGIIDALGCYVGELHILDEYSPLSHRSERLNAMALAE